MVKPKVPREPHSPLVRNEGDVIEYAGPVWRIHRTRGTHVLPWNSFREFGPVVSSRYDPHPPERGIHPGFGIMYTACSVRTSVAEVFQTTRRVNTMTGAPYLTSWMPVRPLKLLDLTQSWAVRNNAAYALTAAPRPTCRAWSHAIHQQWEDLDGLWAPSTMTGESMPVLYDRAAAAIPSAPDFSRPLSHPLVWSLIERAAETVGYGAH
ncbi:RES domain-containing protein [Hoyosella altamirensis]|uniref:RES domain-containing protein n=1 Tax=Hoyosella altamirensis TaxID=616997 RepID=A0A839RPW7_9ACTN|nr:hypothetical protein [Hoyosella altamirensis]